MHPEITPPGHLITAISINANEREWGRTLFAKVYVPIRVIGCPHLDFPLSPIDK